MSRKTRPIGVNSPKKIAARMIWEIVQPIGNARTIQPT